jgi:hypothetical protein
MSGPFGSSQWMYASGGFYGFDIESSLRFNDDDNAYLSWTPDSAGNRKTWTFSCWAKRCLIDNSNREIFGTAAEGDKLGFSDSRIFWFNNGSSSSYLSTTALFRDPSAWYHIVLAFDTTQATASNRVKLYVNSEQVAFDNNTTFPSQQYEGDINNTEAQFIGMGHGGTGSSYDGYLAEVNFIDGTALDPTSFGETKEGIWIPKDPTGLTYGTNGFRLSFADDAEVQGFNTVLWEGNGGTQSVTGAGFSPDFVWIKNRDNADDHYLYDTVRGPNNFLGSNTTTAEDYSSNDLSSFDSDGFTVGSDGGLNRSGQSIVGWAWDAGANNTITGHSSVIYEGSGDNQTISGMPFKADLLWIKERDGTDDHALYDSVRTLESRLESNNTDAEVISYGAIRDILPTGFTLSNSGQINESGKSYVAWGWDAGDGDPVSNTDGSITSTVKASTTNGFSIVSYTGNGSNNSTVGHGLGAVPAWVITKARDNGTDNWAVFHSGLTSVEHYLQLNTTGASASGNDRFGTNEPTSSVMNLGYAGSTNTNGRSYIMYAWAEKSGYSKFGSYTGTGSTGLSVTTGFRPGWLMVKRTDADGNSWAIWDGSRNPFNTMDGALFPNSSGVEDVNATNYIDFDSNGFTIQNTSAFDNADGSTYIYAAFAGSYSDFITDVNTTGDITSRVKANPTYGFSVVSYDGVASADSSTNSGSAWGIGHGLGATPQWVIYKQRTSSNPWAVYHSAVGATKYLALNTAAAAATEQVAFRDTAPTSTVINVGGWDVVNRTGHSYIAYCWSEVSGYSSFGSYTGSGSSGNAVTGLGFKPAWLILKKTEDTNGSWRILDATRSTTNDRNDNLFSNLTNAESVDSNGGVSFDSDGFTLNNSGSANANESGKNYIYAAFADTRDAAFWLDSSGNNQDWQPVNLDHNDTVSDSPTDNFVTLNPLNAPEGTLSEGNLQIIQNGSAGRFIGSTMAIPSSGKFYFEATILNFDATNSRPGCGIADVNSSQTASGTVEDLPKSIIFNFFPSNTFLRKNGSQVYDETDFTSASGDVFMFAVDMDNLKFYMGRNGTYFNSGNPTAGTGNLTTLDAGVSYMPVSGSIDSSSNSSHNSDFLFNFGQQPFKHGPPE